MNSCVRDVIFALYRDFPDEQRARGGEKFQRESLTRSRSRRRVYDGSGGGRAVRRLTAPHRPIVVSTLQSMRDQGHISSVVRICNLGSEAGRTSSRCARRAELVRIWSVVAEMVASHGRCALVTVADIRGSAPREPGARMVIAPDGGFRGTIGGGELEWQAIGAARDALSRRRLRLRRSIASPSVPTSASAAAGACGC